MKAYAIRLRQREASANVRRSLGGGGRYRYPRLAWGASILIVALLAGPGIRPVEAAVAEAAVCKVEWQQLSGRVVAKDPENRRLRLRDKNGNLTHVTIDGKVQILRNYRLVGLDDLKVHDYVVLRRPTEK